MALGEVALMTVNDRQEGAWRPVAGTRQADLAGFVKLVQDHPGFWCWDFRLKYLNITIDTRHPAAFWLRDRDNIPVDPQRVLDAIARQRARP